MIGKVIGAFVGDKLAKKTGDIDGATGAVLGVVATTVLRRMSLPAMLAIGAGGYLAKKLGEPSTKTDRTSTTSV
ncbi:hypothetical protein [Qipengyuania atrilutea]|uniref:Uncharacterized protein n=1 Tax=Qipengyuania atrilutea TaxID=2744473 RepID=A0A850H324_9SPHN|nr:hypothetical protein [Actirhodobacter atriluteus]NVD44990.1 hypothetical protein [Actirhodobacter atriluteus]